MSEEPEDPFLEQLIAAMQKPIERRYEEDMDLSVEPVAAPVIGHRMWDIATRNTIVVHESEWEKIRRQDNLFGSYLEGVGSDASWQGVQAKCIHNTEHKSPVADCSCGYWMVKTPSYLKEVLTSYGLTRINYSEEGPSYSCLPLTRTGATVYGFAWGSVEAWGRIIETTRGYRAEYARPKKLYCYGVSDGVVAQLSKRYNCKAVQAALPAFIIEVIEKRKGQGLGAPVGPLLGVGSAAATTTTTFNPGWVSTGPITISFSPGPVGYSGITSIQLKKKKWWRRK